jgi:CPA2 family monovalent cation:H+ antiporter-2
VAERRRLVRLLLLDACALAAVVIGASRLLHPLALKLARRANVSTRYEPALVAALATAVALPLCVGVVRLSRQLGARLAEAALPSPPGGELDLAAAPRRALAVTLQLACVLLVGAPLLAVTEPFVPLAWSAAVTVVVLVVLGVAFWRSATNLEEHVRAGVQVIVQALAAQSLAPEAHPAPDALADLERVLPGLGRPAVVSLDAASPAVGRTLAELNLRGLSGATVLAIRRGAESHAPTAHERLGAGDELVLTGAEEALVAAREMLRGAEASPPA